MLASAADITAFKIVVGGKNFVTNEIVKYERVGPFIVEVSKGDIFGDVLYGITVVEQMESGKALRRTDLSECSRDSRLIEEKLQYLETLYQDFLQRFQSNYLT